VLSTSKWGRPRIVVPPAFGDAGSNGRRRNLLIAEREAEVVWEGVEKPRQLCPVSNALTGNVELMVSATLEAVRS
jgi:hypothetical protein